MSKVKASMAVLLTALLTVSILAMGCPPPPEVVELPPPPVRMGAWLDEIVGSLADADVAIPMIEAGKLDIFASSLMRPEDLARVRADPGMGSQGQDRAGMQLVRDDSRVVTSDQILLADRIGNIPHMRVDEDHQIVPGDHLGHIGHQLVEVKGVNLAAQVVEAVILSEER